MAQEPITIVLADDHRVVRAGLRAVIEREDDLQVVAEAADGEAAVRSVLALGPRVLFLDRDMPGPVTPLEAMTTVLEASPATRVIVLMTQADPACARRAVEAGAAGHVLKDSTDKELVDAVRRAVADEAGPAVGAAPAGGPPADDPFDGLTHREVEVLQLIALGHTNAEIGAQLFVSVRTVESHRAHIQRKSGRSTRAELVRYALDHGLGQAS